MRLRQRGTDAFRFVRRRFQELLVGKATIAGIACAAGIAALIPSIKYGFALFPQWEIQLRLAQSWTNPTSVVPNDDYVLASPLSFIIPGILGVTSEQNWKAFAVFTAVLGVVVSVIAGGRSVSSQSRLFILIVILGGPVPAVLFQWVGGYDSWFVVFAAVALLTRHGWVRSLGWLFLGFQHSLLALLAWLLLSVVKTRTTGFHRHDLRDGLAIVFGFASLQLLQFMWKASPNRLSEFSEIGFTTTSSLFLWNWPLVLFSALGVVWLLALSPEILPRNGTKMLLSLAVVTTFVLGVVTLDESRTVALALFPTCIWLARYWGEQLEEQTSAAVLRRYLPIAAVVPVVLVWTGNPFATGYTWILEVIFQT